MVIGRHTTVGHRAMLHGCVIGENCLIGMSCTIMNGAKIGKNSVVAAGALVTEDKEFPDGVLIVGVPAKVRRELTEEEIADMCTFPGSSRPKPCLKMAYYSILRPISISKHRSGHEPRRLADTRR